MHIVHILPELEQGGVETVVLELNRELIKAGHQSTVISNGGKLAGQVEQDGGTHILFDVCSKNLLTFPRRISALRHLISDLRPSLVHAHSRVPAWLAWFANKKLLYPWVTTVHGFNSISPYSRIMTKGDRVICVSHPVKDYILQHYTLDAAKVRVIHGGIDPEVFDPDQVDPELITSLKACYGLEGKKVVSSIGRITELKDYETFIRAIQLAGESDPSICGLIAGHVRPDKTDYYNRLKSLIQELGIEDRMQIATDVTDLPALYSASDLMESCSKKPESFGLTLVEALAMNTPVIATRHGGPLDIIQEGRNGSFFTPENVVELAEAVLRNLDEKAVSFREEILAKFSVGRMFEGNLSVYSELTGP
jgi:glycosyltransferase involved in cell wall biosynthesis